METRRGSRAIRAAFALALLARWALPSDATALGLIDGNSGLEIDPSSQAGINAWVANGFDYLAQGWFWIRVGSNPETSVDGLILDAVNHTDRDGNGLHDNLFLRYLDPSRSFSIELQLGLFGGTPGSRFANLVEQVRVTNLSDSVLSVSFFEYMNFDPFGTPDSEGVMFRNLEPPFDDFINGLAQFSLTGVGQFARADFFLDVAFSPLTDLYQSGIPAALLALLNDGQPTDLDPALNVDPVPDVAWATQWSFDLEPGRSWVLGKEFLLFPIPEPSTAQLFFAGLTALLLARRRTL